MVDHLSLSSIVGQLEKQMANAALGQELHVRVSDPAHLIASLRAAETEIKNLTALTTWHPVETAPKDMDLWGNLDDGLGQWQDKVRWSEAHAQFIPVVALSNPARWFDDVKSNGTRITHWMHLPQPPAP